jgi:predicted PurR-regulated permease PerM
MTISVTSVIKKLLLLFLVIAGVYYAKEFLMPLTIGGILATLFLPFSQWLERKKLPKGLAVFACFLSIILIMALIFALLGWKVSELASDFSAIKEKASESIDKLQQYIFNNLGISVKDQAKIINSEPRSYTAMVQKVVGSITTIMGDLLLVFVYFVFLLYYRSHIKNFLLKLSETSKRGEMEKIIESCANVSQQYLVGMSKMIVCLWIMYGIGFSIIGVKNALFFAVLCGLLEIVPFVGNITGTTLTVLVTALNGGNSTTLIGIVATYAVVQFIQGWVLEPLILGPQVKINPLFTIVALILGELLWGIPGIILAIPITAILKIICDNIDSLKPYGFLIGEIDDGQKKRNIIDKIRKKF